MVYNRIPQLSNFNENNPTANNVLIYTDAPQLEKLAQYKLHIKKAKHFYKNNELFDAYHFYNVAKNIAVDILWFEAEAHCLMTIGTINVKWEKFDIAYKNYMNCLNLILDKDLNNSLSLIYFRLSDYYKKANQLKLSKAFSEKAINSIKNTTSWE